MTQQPLILLAAEQGQDGPGGQPCAGPGANTPRVYLGRQRIRRYELNKAIGALVLTVIFTGWITIQWSNLLMRLLAGALLLGTLWITIRSTWEDLTRARGRSLVLDGQTLLIVSPARQVRLPLSQAQSLIWREETVSELGLWFYGRDGQVLAHLDEAFLRDQTEARSFIGWLRQHSGLTLDVRWP